MRHNSKLLIISLLILVTISLNAMGNNDNDESLTSDDLAALIAAKGQYTLIDVRTPEEVAGGYIPTALNIPYDIIADNRPNVAKDDLIIVYCRSGHRAGIARQTLESLGYTHVVNFGGIGNWKGELVKP